MTVKTLLIAAFALSLAACGQNGQSEKDKDAFNKGVEQGFDESFTKSCVSGAVKAGAPAPIASKLCTCTAGKIKAKYKGAQLLSITEDQQMALANECLKESGLEPQ